MNKNEEAVYIVATIKPWNVEEFARRVPYFPGQWLLVSDPASLDAALIRSLKPRFVFFPHWSWKVPNDVLTIAECVCFHMTDVPYGRGGSPLQNLILRGHAETMLSALRMESELDAGPVYMKRALSLKGAAHEIFERCASLVFDMMKELVIARPQPVPQSRTPVFFARRRPEESRLPRTGTPRAVYDLVRMVDAEGYPSAFLEYGDFRLDFRNARLRGDRVEACVTFSVAASGT